MNPNTPTPLGSRVVCKGVVGFKGAGPTERIHREIRRDERRLAAESPLRQSNAQNLKAEQVAFGVGALMKLGEYAAETPEERKKRKKRDKRRRTS